MGIEEASIFEKVREQVIKNNPRKKNKSECNINFRIESCERTNVFTSAIAVEPKKVISKFYQKMKNCPSKLCREATRNETDKSKEEAKIIKKFHSTKLNSDTGITNKIQNISRVKEPYSIINESMTNIRAKAKIRNRQRIIKSQIIRKEGEAESSRLNQLDQSNYLECTQMQSFSLDILENATYELEVQKQRNQNKNKSAIQKLFDIINPFQCS